MSLISRSFIGACVVMKLPAEQLIPMCTVRRQADGCHDLVYTGNTIEGRVCYCNSDFCNSGVRGKLMLTYLVLLEIA